MSRNDDGGPREKLIKIRRAAFEHSVGIHFRTFSGTVMCCLHCLCRCQNVGSGFTGTKTDRLDAARALGMPRSLGTADLDSFSSSPAFGFHSPLKRPRMITCKKALKWPLPPGPNGHHPCLHPTTTWFVGWSTVTLSFPSQYGI